MELKSKTPTLKTLGNDFAAPFNQLTPPSALSNGQPGVIQHAGLTKREYFAALFMAAHLQCNAFPTTKTEINDVIEATDAFIEALNK